ncbi:hypothetical protein ACLOJK_031987 [Asimina triloba]
MGAGQKICDAIKVSAEARGEGISSIPSCLISLDISLPLPRLKPSVIALCRDVFRKWSHFDDSRFAVETVSGGITNLLLKVSVKEDNGNDAFITVRLYGPNTEYVIDRKRELQALPYLSAAGFGAQLLGVFENGMVQSFIDARTLSPTDMTKPKLAAEIARQLHKFHQIAIPGFKEPQLWNDIFKLVDRASTLQFDDKEKQTKYDRISFQEVSDAVKELKMREPSLTQEPPSSYSTSDITDVLHAPVVYAHNDLLSGNIMRNDDEEKLYFIDFEYGSYSYRGYDIGNHFNEYAGLDCDYNLYPNKDAQYHFFRNYLQPDNPQEEKAKMIAPVVGIAKMSPIDFDYLDYFFLRYNEYKKQKDMCFLLAQKYISGS